MAVIRQLAQGGIETSSSVTADQRQLFDINPNSRPLLAYLDLDSAVGCFSGAPGLDRLPAL